MAHLKVVTRYILGGSEGGCKTTTRIAALPVNTQSMDTNHKHRLLTLGSTVHLLSK